MSGVKSTKAKKKARAVIQKLKQAGKTGAKDVSEQVAGSGRFAKLEKGSLGDGLGNAGKKSGQKKQTDAARQKWLAEKKRRMGVLRKELSAYRQKKKKKEAEKKERERIKKMKEEERERKEEEKKRSVVDVILGRKRGPGKGERVRQRH